MPPLPPLPTTDQTTRSSGWKEIAYCSKDVFARQLLAAGKSRLLVAANQQQIGHVQPERPFGRGHARAAADVAPLQGIVVAAGQHAEDPQAIADRAAGRFAGDGFCRRCVASRCAQRASCGHCHRTEHGTP